MKPWQVPPVPESHETPQTISPRLVPIKSTVNIAAPDRSPTPPVISPTAGLAFARDLPQSESQSTQSSPSSAPQAQTTILIQGPGSETSQASL